MQQKKRPKALSLFYIGSRLSAGMYAFSFYGAPTRFNEVGRAEASVALMSAERSFCAIRLPNAMTSLASECAVARQGACFREGVLENP